MRITLMGALLGVVLTLSAAPAVGQHMNAKDAPCRGPATTADEAACFASALKARNQELAKLLDTVRPAVDGDELTLLNRAQARWQEYRELSCDAEKAMYFGGTAAGIVELACLEALARDRTRQLHDAYDWRVEKYQWTVEHPRGGLPERRP